MRSNLTAVRSLVPHVPAGYDYREDQATAAAIVSTHLVGQITDEVLLTRIENRLVAHFACLAYPPPMSESGTGVSVSVSRGTLGAGLKATQHGQLAMQLDTTGTLSAISEMKSIEFLPLGID